MSNKKLYSVVLCLGLPLLLSLPARATVETKTIQSMQSAGTPADMATSADGHWLFVLTTQGQVEIYETSGALKATVKISGPADKIACSPTGDLLYLSDKATGVIKVVSLNFIHMIDTAGSPFKGPEKAPVEVVVFSDFQCPYCARVGALMDEVLKAYPKEVKVVFKNFPLQSHQQSMPAALAALAAHRQGKFWEMHDMIFDNYATLSEERLTDFAKALGLDMEKFDKDRKDPQLDKQVHADLQSGGKAEVRGTPTIFVNGRLLNSRSFSGAKALIDEELGKSKP